MKSVQKKTYVKGIIKQNLISCSDKDSVQVKDFSFAKFKIVKGKRYKGQEVESYFSTGNNGNFFLELPPGTYSIVEAERPEKYSAKKKDGKLLWNTLCLTSKWSEPLHTFTLEISDPVDLEILIDRSH